MGLVNIYKVKMGQDGAKEKWQTSVNIEDAWKNF